MEVATFDAPAAARFGVVAATLAGAPLGDVDALVAAHALSLHLVLVTNNVRHFGRVAGLKAERRA